MLLEELDLEDDDYEIIKGLEENPGWVKFLQLVSVAQIATMDMLTDGETMGNIDYLRGLAGGYGQVLDLVEKAKEKTTTLVEED